MLIRAVATAVPYSPTPTAMPSAATIQMPAGIPVGTLALGKAGAVNAALLAIAILANQDAKLKIKLKKFKSA